MKKDTIYIDIDDEITNIVEKLQDTKEAIVALVLPKRCTVLQSSVNMKILKKAGETAKKKLVIITHEAAILPLAGMAGLYVAKNLQSKPYLPAQGDSEPLEVATKLDDEPEIDPSKSLEELSGAAPVNDEEAPIEIDTSSGEDEDGDKTKKSAKNKKLKVPNFDKFRVRLFLIVGGVIAFIVLLYVALAVLPKAKVTITTQNRAVPVDLIVTADPGVTALDASHKIVPATLKTIDKTESKKFTATGQKNNGDRATGTMTIYNCTDNQTTVPAGTVFTNNSLSFATNNAVDIPGSNFTSGGDCKEDGRVAGVPVTATSGGDSYNLSAGRAYTSNISGKIYGKGSAMGGGTNKIVTVISQTDCDNAKNDILNTKTDDYKNLISAQISSQNLIPIKDSFAVAAGSVKCTPDVGQEASDSTVSVVFKVSMTGVDSAGVEQIVKQSLASSLHGSQTVVDSGLKSANIVVKDRSQNGQFTFQLLTDAVLGVKPDVAGVAKLIAGKKKGDSISVIKSQEGVSGVKISYSPFWVYKTPSNTKHITVKFINNVSK